MAIGNAIAVAATLLAIAGVLIAVVTSRRLRYQAKLDFLRTAMERGVPLDPESIDKVMHPSRTAAAKRALPRGQGARVAGILTIAFGVGYAVFAGFIALVSPSALFPLLGVACLFIFVGIGLLVVSRVLRNEPGVTDQRN
jgi:hypothetical protein